MRYTAQTTPQWYRHPATFQRLTGWQRRMGRRGNGRWVMEGGRGGERRGRRKKLQQEQQQVSCEKAITDAEKDGNNNTQASTAGAAATNSPGRTKWSWYDSMSTGYSRQTHLMFTKICNDKNPYACHCNPSPMMMWIQTFFRNTFLLFMNSFLNHTLWHATMQTDEHRAHSHFLTLQSWACLLGGFSDVDTVLQNVAQGSAFFRDVRWNCCTPLLCVWHDAQLHR